MIRCSVRSHHHNPPSSLLDQTHTHHILTSTLRPSLLPGRAGPLGPLRQRNKDSNWLEFIARCIVRIPTSELLFGGRQAGSDSPERLHEDGEVIRETSLQKKKNKKAEGRLGRAAPSGVERERDGDDLLFIIVFSTLRSDHNTGGDRFAVVASSFI